MKTKLARITTTRKAVDATRCLTLRVTETHIEQGVPGNMNQCVFACSLKDHFGDTIQDVEVGTRVTKIYTPGQVTRYLTPSSLREPIRHYDLTGNWNMPVGDYIFLPVTGMMKLGARKVSPATKRRSPAFVRSSNFNGRALATRQSHFTELDSLK